MKNDPGLFRDSTGDGMAGEMDVSFETQQELKNTIYNGSKSCKGCGAVINPVQSLSNAENCPSCNRRKKQNLLKGMMA
jgi:rubrerythrin